MVFLLPALAVAQRGRITGNVVLPNGSFLNERARVKLQTDHGVKSDVFTDDQGRFQFNSLVPTVYTIIVEADRNRFEIATATVEVFPNAPVLLTITLAEKKADGSKKAAGTVSAGELNAAVPPKAKKEFERATEASREGKTDEAIAHLKKAIELYPGFLMAHNDLGTQLLAKSRFDEAENEFRRAIELDPSAFNPRLNLGILLVEQHRFSEATEALKQAISLDGNSPAARLYDGVALAGLNNLDAAVQELKAAHELGGATYALALFHLGEVYLNKNDREQARKAFESYLREAPNAANAAEVRQLMATIR
jgi:Flp pilus assembly protein TadD